MIIQVLFDQLLTQLDGNETAVNALANFVFNNNYNQNRKLAILEQIKQNLANITINDDTIDIKTYLELSVITEAINQFNNHIQAEQNIKKRENSPSSSSVSVVPYASKKPNLTPSFERYCGLASSSSAPISSIVSKLSHDIISFKQPELQVLWKKSQPLQLQGEIVPILVSHNAAIFKIQDIDLEECWCTDSLDRSKDNNTRTKMEENIVNTIAKEVLDKTKKIRLVNIGSDRIGLLVILSKLYLLGYKTIDVINLETKDKQMFVDCQKEKEDYCNLLKTIFSDASYNYLEVYNSNKTSVALNVQQISSPAEITIFFAEDLGGLDDTNENKQYAYNSDYKNAIANALLLVTALFSPEEKNLIFYSKHNGDISKKTMSQRSNLANFN